MKQIKGFSLIEVLISLMLVTTLALMLLDQQLRTRQLIKQWVLQSGASHFLDQVNETVYGQSSHIPRPPEPYYLNIERNKKNLVVQLEWFNKSGRLTRTIRNMG